MTIRRGLTNIFEEELLQANHDFTGKDYKLALFTNDVVLNHETEIYTASNEIAAWNKKDGTPGYEAGGIVITTSVGSDEHGSFVEVEDVTLENVPADTVFRAGLIYNSALASANAVLVVDWGRDLQSPNGKIKLLFSQASRGRPLIRLSTRTGG